MEGREAKQMNGDLISREEAIELIRSLSISIGGKEIFHPEAKKSVIEALDLSPTVDAAPVVRCRECKCRGTNDCPMYMSFYDGEEDYYSDSSTDDGFCHCGVKMDGDADA